MRVPTGTYRLQVSAEFDLFACARVLRYLHDLGVDWVYLSPLLTAEAGSTHGYDVASHRDVDPSRGGRQGLQALSAEARRLGMGVLVDIVPNHVGVATPLPGTWWWDVLQHGRASAYAAYFDVDWEAGGDRILLPVVGDEDLDGDLAGDGVAHLRVVEDKLVYHDKSFPLAPGTSGPDASVVHAAQHYRLVGWRLGDTELNYRRFFTVTSLAGIRVEDPSVFAASHVEIGRWFEEHLVDGLRVDHPDGLRDPAAYLEDLATLTGGAYVLVEKILALEDASRQGPSDAAVLEELPRQWVTAGTTGYDALALVDRVLTDPAGEGPLTALDTRLRGQPLVWQDLVHDTKRAAADGALNAEVRRIVRELRTQAQVPMESEERGTSVSKPPPTFDVLADAVAELLACFPVYRTYLPVGREHLGQAFGAARERRADLATAFDTLERELSDPGSAVAQRFQQTSGMVMAKGVEDCAFYRYSRLTSLNEVGGDPSLFSLDVSDFHAAMAVRQTDWPQAMTTLSTHDTKRGEDVRARITALAELPRLWADGLERLLELAPMPDPGFGSLLWQAILGAWPASPGPELRSRLHAYAEKAMREAGDHTTWTAPDVGYEAAVHHAVDAAFDNDKVRPVLDGLLARVVGAGWSNALAAKLLALTMPGVPDVYQGSELWEQSLVDPDNRRPVDFGARSDVLETVRVGVRTALSAALDDPGFTKLEVVRAGLHLRRDRARLFTSYDALAADGDAKEHVLAFDRGGAVTVVTRLPIGLSARGGWGSTTLTLPAGSFVEQVSGTSYSGTVRLADLLATLPVALLARQDR